MKKSLTVVIFLIAAGCILPVSVWAKEGGACAADIQKFCADAQKGKGGIAKCLNSHTDELAQECRDSLGKFKEKAKSGRQHIKQNCSEDLKTLCPDTKRGQALGCLKENMDKLSPVCKDSVSKIEGRAQPAAASE